VFRPERRRLQRREHRANALERLAPGPGWLRARPAAKEGCLLLLPFPD
jgi:hypothetical protein